MRGTERIHAKVKVCLVGADRGCKTRLVRSHVQEAFDDTYLTTLGTKVSKKVLRANAPGVGSPALVDILLWDILSARGSRDVLREAYFSGSKGILAVADMTRRSTLRELDDSIRDVQGVAGPVPVVILAANRDRTDRLEMTEEEVARVAKEHNAGLYFASGTADEGVEEAFESLAESVLHSLLFRGSRGEG